jgi:hypothetical protein
MRRTGAHGKVMIMNKQLRHILVAIGGVQRGAKTATADDAP